MNKSNKIAGPDTNRCGGGSRSSFREKESAAPQNTETFYSQFKEPLEEQERLKRIAEILSEGVYTYLKKGGFLRDDTGGAESARKVLEKVKSLSTKAEDEMVDEGQQ